MQADLFLCGQGHAAQGKPGVGRLKPCQRILGGGLRRVAGGEVKELFPAAFAHGFQGREEHAHGFADAGGSLTEQPGAAFVVGVLPGAAGAPDFARQCPLPGTVGVKRKPQGGQAAAAGFFPVQLTVRPRQILTEEFGQKIFQLLLRKMPRKTDDPVGIDLIIGQPHVDFRQTFLRTVNGTVHHALRPVTGVHFLGNFLFGHSGGLDLVDGHNAVFIGENAVRPAFQRKDDAVHLPVGGEGHFGFVAVPGGFLQPAVDARALKSAVEAGKAAVDAAAAQQKFHQLPDGQTDRGHGISPPCNRIYSTPNNFLHCSAASSTLAKSTAER